jgi:hypothetical protein
LKCAVEFVTACILNLDLVDIYEDCSNERNLMLDRVQLPSRKNEWTIDLDKMKMSRQPGAVVPAPADRFLCIVDPSAGVSGMPASSPVGTVFNVLSSFTLNSPQMGFI